MFTEGEDEGVETTCVRPIRELDDATTSSGLGCEAFEGVPKYLRLSAHVVVLHSVEPEACTLYEIRDLPGDMAASSYVLPQWFDPRLPAGDAGIGGSPMLDKVERAAGPEYPSNLSERCVHVRNRAQRPGR